MNMMYNLQTRCTYSCEVVNSDRGGNIYFTSNSDFVLKISSAGEITLEPCLLDVLKDVTTKHLLPV